jgi:hypothetical protein
MKRLISELTQLAGFFTALCGIICGMCETENQLRTMLIGFVLLIAGAAICYIGKELEYGAN